MLPNPVINENSHLNLFKYNFYLLIYNSDLYRNYENIVFPHVTALRREKEKIT